VLLHGQPGSGADWRQVADRLPTELRVVALDRPGYGASRQGAGGFGYNARAVVAELDARGIERAVLVGHSYGGGAALAVAQLAPERAEALVLLASVGPGCLTGWDRLLAAPVAGPVCSLFAWKLTPWLARARMRRPIGRLGADGAGRRHVNTYVWGFTRWDHGPLWRTFLAEQRALMGEAGQLAALATQVKVPVLLLADRNDTMVPFRTAVALSRSLPDARLVPVEGAGHHLPLRAAAEVASEMAGFLESLDAPTRAREQA